MPALLACIRDGATPAVSVAAARFLGADPLRPPPRAPQPLLPPISLPSSAPAPPAAAGDAAAGDAVAGDAAAGDSSAPQRMETACAALAALAALARGCAAAQEDARREGGIEAVARVLRCGGGAGEKWPGEVRARALAALAALVSDCAENQTRARRSGAVGLLTRLLAPDVPADGPPLAAHAMLQLAHLNVEARRRPHCRPSA